MQPDVFYPLKSFELSRRKPLAFPDFMQLSNNYFRKKWTNWHRLKNVAVYMDVIPGEAVDGLQQCKALALAETVQKDAEAILQRMWNLYARGSGSDTIPMADVKDLVQSYFGFDTSESEASSPLLPTSAGSDSAPSSELTMTNLAARLRSTAHDGNVSFADLKNLILGPTFRQVHGGRYTVVLSLAEAETVRRIIHLRQDVGGFAIDGHRTSLALRSLLSDGGILDTSRGFETPPVFQAGLTAQALRYFDGEMFFTPTQMKLLLAGVQSSPTHLRQVYFETINGCRRRSSQRWREAPIGKVFLVPTEFHLALLGAQMQAVNRALAGTGLELYQAYARFDTNKDDMLDMDEVHEMLVYLGFSPSPDDTLDFIECADEDGDGRISFKEFKRRLHTSARALPQAIAPSASDGAAAEGASSDSAAAAAAAGVAAVGAASAPSTTAVRVADGVPNKSNAELRAKLDEAKQRRIEEAKQRTVLLDELKKEQTAMVEEVDASINDIANPDVNDQRAIFSFTAKRLPRLVQWVRGRGELIPDQLQGKKG